MVASGEHAIGSEDLDVEQQIVHEPRVYARGAKGLRLPAAPDAHAALVIGVEMDLSDGLQQLLRVTDLDVVDAWLEAVGGAERLAHDQVGGREVERDAVLERR